MSILFNLLAFIVAVGILVTFHEFGHYWVARKMGVKVLRFSVGFGKPLWTYIAGKDRTEYVIAAIPLGGYVKMLDEREGEVQPGDLERAFNRQKVGKRIAIVAAGPIFNFIFAILAYWLMFMIGVNGIKPIIGEVTPRSIAAEAAMAPGDHILSVNGEPTPTWETTTISLLNQALETGTVTLEVQRQDEVQPRQLWLDLSNTRHLLDEGDLLEKLGISPWRPTIEPVIGKLVEGGAAQRADLRAGDRIISADGEAMSVWNDWVNFIRARPNQKITVLLDREGNPITLELRTEARLEDGLTLGRIGAYPHIDRDKIAAMRVLIRYGPIEGLLKAVGKTWEIGVLTLRVMWRLITGEASLKNISGPVTIAEFAGVSAAIGLSAFLGALAIFSISIGILNLLPVPILDGGHLLYYVIELIKGSPVSETTEAVGQRLGLAMLAGLMALAFYNDFLRLID
ncbi:MAG: RIP metalloprotease RseP [Pseudomonadota bacterium]